MQLIPQKYKRSKENTMNTNKLYNLDEVDKLTHILPKLNDEIQEM